MTNRQDDSGALRERLRAAKFDVEVGVDGLWRIAGTKADMMALSALAKEAMLSPQGSEPDGAQGGDAVGFVMLPIDPTNEMLEAIGDFGRSTWYSILEAAGHPAPDLHECDGCGKRVVAVGHACGFPDVYCRRCWAAIAPQAWREPVSQDDRTRLQTALVAPQATPAAVDANTKRRLLERAADYDKGGEFSQAKAIGIRSALEEIEADAALAAPPAEVKP